MGVRGRKLCSRRGAAVTVPPDDSRQSRIHRGDGSRGTACSVAHSYTYTQPDSKTLYHGTVDVERVGPRESKVVYSLFYDQSNLPTAQARAQARAQRATLFMGALESMNRLAEAR
jgi:hypothetical protein